MTKRGLLRWPTARGALSALGMVAVLTAALLPERAYLGPATVALVFVVPVVAAVSIGGFGAGVLAAGVCFLVYDYMFLPPYYTLYVARGADWAALGVYGAVAVIVARVVSALKVARAESQRRAEDVRRLFDVSELLVRELPGRALVEDIVCSLRSAFDLRGVALLLPVDGRLQPVACAGYELSPEEAAHLTVGGAVPVSLGPTPAQAGEWQAVALVASGDAVGLLAVCGAHGGEEQELMRAFANHLALALERESLQEEAARARLLAEVDQLRRALVGAVSHDLRTPLATIKLSASTLLDSAGSLGPGDVKELAELVDAQANRLDRLVTNLLDMTRIQAGTLELRRQVVAVQDLVEEALAVLGRSTESPEVRLALPDDLPLVEVDPVLVRQVLANLLDNAFRYSPEGAPVAVEARVVPAAVAAPAAPPVASALEASSVPSFSSASVPRKLEVAVSDQGPGVPEEERERIFSMFERREAGGRGGLGLAIAQAFVQAHGERIWVAPTAPGGGARFAFTLPEGAPRPACS